MKSIFCTISLLLLIGLASRAQSWAEFFKQKKTQRLYLAKQITGLQVYLSFAKQGYKIVQDGTGIISSLKKGDFRLHRKRFSALKNPSTKIKKLSLLADITRLQDHILNLGASYLKAAARNDSFHPDELSYQQRVFQILRGSCAQTMKECERLRSDAQLELTDDQRINRLRELLGQMSSHLEFCKDFVQQGMALASARTSELRDIHLEQRLNHLNPAP